MAYTEADLTSVRQAILTLATGQREAEVRFANGRSVRFAEANLADLRKLEASIKAELDSAAGKSPRMYRINTRRGL